MSSDGERVEALLTEVTNTPWGERQDYVIAAADSPVIRASFQKTMHVSPFMPMDQCYLARATPRGDTVSVHIENRDAGGRAWPRLLRGSRGLAEAYEDGFWESPDVVAVIRLAAMNARGFDRWRAVLAPLLAPAQRLAALRAPSTRERNRREIAAHYDLGS